VLVVASSGAVSVPVALRATDPVVAVMLRAVVAVVVSLMMFRARATPTAAEEAEVEALAVVPTDVVWVAVAAKEPDTVSTPAAGRVPTVAAVVMVVRVTATAGDTLTAAS